MAVLGLLAVSACDIPTEAPYWESRWIVPAQATEIALDEFLPAGVSIAADGSGFLVSVAPFSQSQSLGELCSACSAADGSTVPKPPFSSAFPAPGSLPPEIISAELAEGQFLIELTNGFSFDPIRPGLDNEGQLTVTLFNEWESGDSEALGTAIVDGADTAFPPGSSVVRELNLTPGPISPVLRAEVSVVSPEGDETAINASEAFAVDVQAVMLRVVSVEVDVSGRQVQLEPVALDLEDLDDDIVDRVRAGGFTLDVQNPFGVALDLSFRIDGPGFSAVERTVSIPPTPTSSASVSLTGDEIRSFLAQPDVTLSGEGVVSPTTPTITVRPGQVFTLNTKVDLTVLIGGGQ